MSPLFTDKLQIQESIIKTLIQFGFHVVAALVILILGWAASNLVSRWVEKWLERSEHIDFTLAPVLSSTVKVIILGVTFIAVLSRFGIKMTSLVALIGSIGLGIGLALQGTLSNIAAGMMLLTLRPFRAGDSVNLHGTVAVIDEIGLFTTEMHSFENVYISMPNSNIWNQKIENYTRNPNRRINLEYRIHYKDDIDEAMNVINDIIDNDERVLQEPEPLIAVSNLSENSVKILVRPWAHPDHWWKLQLDLNKRIKERFDQENITIPYPQQGVHITGLDTADKPDEAANI